MSIPLACSTSPGSSGISTVAFLPHLVAPSALFDRVTALNVSAYEGDVTCTASSGRLDGLTPDMKPVATATLSAAACTAGGRFCGSLELTQSATPRIFLAEGLDANGALFASGCGAATVDSAAVDLSITLKRYFPPATCGNGIVETGETCEKSAASDPSCDDACQSPELLLSSGSAANGTQLGGPQDRTEPRIGWASTTAPSTGQFIAVYTDKSLGTNRDQVAVRRLASDFAPDSAPAFASRTFFLPNDAVANSGPPAPAAGAIRQPSVVASSAVTYVAYVRVVSTTQSDIELTAFDNALHRPSGFPMVLATGAGVLRARPKIARGPTGRFYVLWQEEVSKKLVGRGFTEPTTLGSVQEVAATGNENDFDLAGTNSGFVAVWDASSDIHIRAVGPDGTPSGGDSLVNDNTDGVQALPRVAALADGRFAVAFVDRRVAPASARLQRFTSFGRPVAGDQTRAFATGAAEAREASIALADGVCVLGWIDAGDGAVRARFFGSDGSYLLNPIDGTEAEVTVSRSASKTRGSLRISLSTNGLAAFTWEDPATGIVGRKFPLPSP